MQVFSSMAFMAARTARFCGGPVNLALVPPEPDDHSDPSKEASKKQILVVKQILGDLRSITFPAWELLGRITVCNIGFTEVVKP